VLGTSFYELVVYVLLNLPQILHCTFTVSQCTRH